MHHKMNVQIFKTSYRRWRDFWQRMIDKKKSVTLIMLRAGYGDTRQKNYSSYMMLKEVVNLSQSALAR